MGKKNKPVFNGYACFMNDFGKKTGQKFNSKKDLAEAAASHWAQLTPQQQQVYKDKAKGLKNDGAKYTSQGKKVDDIISDENRRKQCEQDMNNYINSLMISLSESNEFLTHMFYQVSINEFCFVNGSGRHVPAEIAVIKFNLQEGVIEDNVFHYIVKPGKLPLGYTAEATKISNDTHQLPVPLGIDESDDNRAEITEALLKFMRAGYSTVERDFPPLFCEDKYKQKVQNVIKYFLRDQGYSDDLIKVYSLDLLFYQLRNATNATEEGELIWPSITLSTLELERDVYDYCPGIACDFHDNTDVPNFCTRSKVIRLTYIICENCCPSLDVTLIPGHHIPAKATSVEAAVAQNDTLSTISGSRKTSNRPKHSFLSSRAESEASFHTDFTYEGDDDNASVSESSQSGWIPAHSRKPRREMTIENSEPVTNISSSTQSEPLRRPTVTPAALGKEFGQMSLSDKHRAPGAGSSSTSSFPISRGRGRGAFAKLKEKN